MKKTTIWLLVLLLSFSLLSGCGAKSADRGTAANGSVEYSKEMMSGSADGLTASTASGAPLTSPNQKLIRKVRLEAETEDMGSVLSAMGEKLATLGGYVEQQEIYNGSQYDLKRYRNAEMTIRIPADKLSEFVSQIKENTNVISSKESAEDITLSYVATQSRVSALETEHTRLLELLAKAESTKDLLEIEQRLTEVRAELEEYTSQLRIYDNLVDYATVNLTLREVKEYTVVEEPETIWQRIGTGLLDSLKSIAEGFTEVFVFLVVGLPYWILFAVVIAVAWIIFRFALKKKKHKNKDNSNE